MREPDTDPDRPGKVPLRALARLLWPLFRPRLGHFAGAFGLLVVSSLLMIAGPVLIKRAIDVDIPGKDLAGLHRTVLLYLALQLAFLVVMYVMRNWLEWTGQGMMAALRRKLFGHLLHLPLEFHDRNTPGQLLSRVESDTQALRMLFTTTAVMLLGDLLLFVGMFVVMLYVSPRLTAVTAIVAPALIGLTVYFQRKIHPLFVRVREQNSDISGRLTEFLQAMPVVGAFARNRWALADFQRLNRAKFDTNYHAQRLIVLWFNLLFMLETFAFAAILGLGGYWALAGLETIGTLALFVGYVRRFFEPVLRLSEQLAMIQKALAASERIAGLLDEPLVVEDAPQPADWPGLRRGVRFESVWFRYDEEGEWILKDVSFEIPAGQRFALVGPTGSGKTTIINLLLRFYDPQRGRITIDGVDIRGMRQADLRRHAGLVLQDIHLLPGDLRENLNLGREYPPEQIEVTARTTLADPFIRELPGGYDARLAERGANLSFGQRQLLSFTRALLREPQLLVLDEATSAVDPATEARLSEATHRLLEGRTALVIAHRLSTIRDCHQILVLQHGRVVQRGTHAELLDGDGLYRNLYELQRHEESHVG